MSLLFRVREYWRGLKHGSPGRRFEDRYDRSAGARKRQPLAWRVAKVVAGVGLVAIGLVEMVLPGPAILFFFFGGALLATQSRGVARAMDWAELRARRVWRFLRRKARAYRHHSVTVLVTACTGALAGIGSGPAMWG